MLKKLKRVALKWALPKGSAYIVCHRDERGLSWGEVLGSEKDQIHMVKCLGHRLVHGVDGGNASNEIRMATAFNIASAITEMIREDLELPLPETKVFLPEEKRRA